MSFKNNNIMVTVSISAPGPTLLCFSSGWESPATSVPEENHGTESRDGQHFVSCSAGLTNGLYLDLAHLPNLLDFS